MKKASRMNRRGFLSTVCAGTCGAAIHQASYGGSGMFAYGAPPVMGAMSAPGSVFILVNLAGGCSYNITPIYHAAWRDRNPTISRGPENSLALNGEQGLHPAFTYLKQIYDEGNLALINGVGLPSQSRSHDEATTQWFRANGQGGNADGGWAARLTSQAAGSLFSGISLAGTNDLIRGGTNPPRALSDLANFGEDRLYWNDEWTGFFRDTRDSVMAQSSTQQTDGMQFVKSSMENIQRSLEIIKAETSRPLPGIPDAFPNTGFARACQDAAKLIAAPALGVRFIFLQQGGYDTHSNEINSHNNLFGQLHGGLRSLIQTAKALGRWNDVSIATMSEFCRTVENGNGGTDHGAKAPLMLMGGDVAGRVVNPAPSDAEIRAAGSFLSGYDVDFRQIYREAVTRMGFNADLIFPNTISFSPLGLFR